MAKNSKPNTEDDFVVLLKELRNNQRSVDDFLKDLVFENWLRSRCYKKFDFRIFDEAYGPEDFIQECQQKVQQAVPKLEPQNTPNRSAFFGWAKMVLRNTFLDALRKHNKPLNHGMSRSSEPIEVLEVPTFDLPFDIAYERRELLKRFLKFLEGYPEKQRCAVLLWLQDYSPEYSFREIADEMKEQGFEKCCYGSVRLWVIKVLDDFKVNIGLQPPPSGRERER